VTRPAAPLPELAAALHALAERVQDLDVAQVLGELEALRVRLWMTATNHAPAPASSGPSRGLDVTAVAERMGVSKDWVYRGARKGHLPFARHLGRRWVFDEAAFMHWFARR
jgi:excisionase family DNA binding protein